MINIEKVHLFIYLLYIYIFFFIGISMSLELDDIHQMELELFEVSGCPILGVPKRARENEEHQVNRMIFFFSFILFF